MFHNFCRDHHETIALSSAHDLAICTRSAQTSHKERISSLQLRLSPHARKPHLIWITLSRCLSSFFIGRRHAAFSSVSFCRLQSSEMGFANNPPVNTVRIAMTSRTQIQNPATRLAHVPHVPDRYTAVFYYLCNCGESRPPPSMSSNHVVAEGVFQAKARSFASDQPSLFPGLPRCAIQAWLENCCSHNNRASK